MKKLILFASLALLAFACSKEDRVSGRPEYGNSNKEKTVFYASTESTATPQTGTKVYADEDLRVLWNENDYISIFNYANVNDKYMFDGEDGDNGGSFSFEEEGPEPSVPVDLDHIYAIYPYSASTEASVDDGQVTIAVDLPAEQTYKEHSFGIGANTMVAVTDNNFLGFKNVCGYLRFRFYGDDVTVKSVTLEGNNGEKIAGSAVITPSTSAAPAVTMQSGATGIIAINSPEGVALGTTSATATEFIFVVPPTVFSGGFKITVTDNKGGVFEKSSTRSLTISRNKMESMGAMKVTPVPAPEPIKPLTFTSTGSTSIALTKVGDPDDVFLEYKIDDGEWTDYTVGDAISLSNGQELSFRAGPSGNESFALSGSHYHKFAVTGSGTVAASGNIMSLLDKEGCLTIPSIYCFCQLFYDCASLTSTPELPATNLADNCYNGMFIACTRLAKAPELPATSLANGCYANMFSACTSLTTAPELPSTSLAESCYEGMFSSCASLTKAPELPATSLVSQCYRMMFRECISLTTAPELPATTLAYYCYGSMFDLCSSLIIAPELPATTLAESCYDWMFARCTSLSTAPELTATTLANNCYRYMFYGCTLLTTAPELPSTTLARSCYSNMFEGCTGLTTAPDLPATTVTHGCYYEMFKGCTGLSIAPELKSTTLAEYCYSGMFQDCTRLATAPELPATSLARSCYSGMFSGCIRLTTAPELPATSLARSCYSGMFSGCIRLTTAPELPALFLTYYCYENMFSGCSYLNYVKALFTSTPSSSYISGWLWGVSSTGTFVKNKDATWDIGVSGIPSGWTIITE